MLSMSTTRMTCPLFFLVYLLTADWDMPRILATSSCFRPWFSTNCVATNALIAGTTDFTATSHGSIKGSSLFGLFAGGKLYKYGVCHNNYDVCHNGTKTKNFGTIIPLSPTRMTYAKDDHACKRKASQVSSMGQSSRQA